MWKDLRQEIVVTGFSCDKALADRARAYAKEHGNRGLSSLIREALQEYMDRKDGVSKK